ncbi:MAG: RNase III inhibitor [Ruminococcaceae bacterium]|nr:RNase III inhibitor [Oscillospiraceae bacterium]
MPLFIERNDITEMNVDAVVNSANEKLLPSSSGVNSIIHKKAGSKLAAELSKLSPIKRGEVVITKGYNLKASYIIHTLGPVWEGGSKNESEILYNCYKNSLELAKKNRIKSIAFPLISSGVFGFPKDKALKIAESAIKNFLFDIEDDMLVYLAVFDKSSFKISEELYKEVKEYISDNYADRYRETRRIYAQRLSEVSYREMASLPMQAPAEKASSKKQSLEDKLKKLDESFQEMLFRKIDESGMKDSLVYKKANVDRKHFSKIKKDKYYHPKKETVLCFAIALELSLKETENMLKKAGYALSESSMFDVIVRYFIENSKYDIIEINNTLFSFDQNLLTGN